MPNWLEASNFINLIGGLIIIFFLAWQVVEKAFGNVGWIKGRRENREKIQREKRQKEIISLIEEVIVPPIIEEIESINNEQNIKLDKLIRSSNDTIRVELLRTYFKYRPYKKIPQWAKESAANLYEDYAAQDGNTFVKDLWAQMVTWEVVSSDEEVEKKDGGEI